MKGSEHLWQKSWSQHKMHKNYNECCCRWLWIGWNMLETHAINNFYGSLGTRNKNYSLLIILTGWAVECLLELAARMWWIRSYSTCEFSPVSEETCWDPAALVDAAAYAESEKTTNENKTFVLFRRIDQFILQVVFLLFMLYVDISDLSQIFSISSALIVFKFSYFKTLLLF